MINYYIFTMEIFILYIMIGMLTGAIAAQIFKGYGFGTTGNIVVGITGGILGGILVDLFDLWDYGMGAQVLLALVGGFGLLLMSSLIARNLSRQDNYLMNSARQYNFTVLKPYY